MLILIFLNVVGGLLLEAHGARNAWPWAEAVVSTVTLLHFCYYFLFPPKIFGFDPSRWNLVACLTLATTGELILSALWGVYSYRQSILPAFVPPGHVLIFLSGLVISSHKKCPSWVTLAVPMFGGAFICYAITLDFDFLSLPLFAIFVVCLLYGPNPKLYAVMFVIALALELLGTGVGAWRWTAMIPGFAFPSANPPVAAGVFYAMLDLLSVSLSSTKRVKVLDQGPIRS